MGGVIESGQVNGGVVLGIDKGEEKGAGYEEKHGG